MKLRHTKARNANHPFFEKKASHVKHSAIRYARRGNFDKGKYFGFQTRTQAIRLDHGVVKTIQHVVR